MLITAAIVSLLVVGIFGLRVLQAAAAAQGAVYELRALQTADMRGLSRLEPVRLADMQGRFARLEADLGVVAEMAGPFLPATRVLGWLPGIGAEVQAAPDLLQLALGVATAGRASMDAAYLLAHAMQYEQDNNSALARLVPALEQTQPSWQEVQAALLQVAAARSRLQQTQLDPRVIAQLERLDSYLPLLQTGADLAMLAPALMGTDSPRSYLLLAQNSDELRPTGGFISGVGLLRIDQGQLSKVDFEDSYAVYNPEVDHPPAPPDLEQMMGAQILLFRDANWSADFPTTARVLQSLYQLDTGASTDGVIAFDLEATRRLITALEPLTLPGYEEPVTGNNVLEAIRQVWADPLSTEHSIQDAGQSDWWLHRKDFMGDLAESARAKLESGQVDYGKLAMALYSSLQEKHLLMAVNDEASASLLADAGWNGSIDPGEGDFLLVVDSNVGWNKVNSVVQRDTFYTIAPRPDGSAVVELELVYRHHGESTNEPCVHVARYGDSYEDMVRRCYFNYVRVLAPPGVRLIRSEGFERNEVSTRPGERGTTQLAGSLVIPPGDTRRAHLTYELPAGLIAERAYTLRIKKQPGIPAWPVHLVMIDPSGEWQPVTPAGQRSDTGVEISFELQRDADVIIAQRR